VCKVRILTLKYNTELKDCVINFPAVFLSLFMIAINLCAAQEVQVNKTMKRLPGFGRIVIDSNFTNAYQVTATDVNKDDRMDVLAISTELSEVYWYENPHWQRHLITNETKGNIDLTPKDIDRDGDFDLVLASGFNFGRSSEPGQLYWLENQAFGRTWILHDIDTTSVPHRVRWGDVNGDGVEELINLPILGYGAAGPEYPVGVEFAYFEVPLKPKESRWKKVVIDTTLHMAHGLLYVNGSEAYEGAMFTASFEGVRLFELKNKTKTLSRNYRQITLGDTSSRPQAGCSEVALGHFKGENNPFIATIEPWHGHQVVCYTPRKEGVLWARKTIDTTFLDGHALLTADLNQDGYSEVIAGHRGPDYSLYIYQFNVESERWSRFDLDKGGMSTAGLFLLDFNEDGYLDIVAAGSATHNVVLYMNLAGQGGLK